MGYTHPAGKLYHNKCLFLIKPEAKNNNKKSNTSLISTKAKAMPDISGTVIATKKQNIHAKLVKKVNRANEKLSQLLLTVNLEAHLIF